MHHLKKLNFFILFSLFLVHGCNDCGECFTPPQSFNFEIVDRTSGENVFTYGTYEPNQIKITNTVTNSPAEFRFIAESDINLIQFNMIGWETETVNLQVDISDDKIFEFFVDAERKEADCCSFTEYKEVRLEGADFEQDAQSGIFTVYVDL